MNIKNLKQLSCNDRLNLRKIQNKYYLIAGRSCYEVNNTGASIVNVIGQDITLEELCEKLSTKYHFEDISIIKSDVIKFINYLINEGMITTE